MRWLVCVAFALSFINSATPCRAGGVLLTPAQAAQYGELQALGLVLLDLDISVGPTTNPITASGSQTGDTWSLSVNTPYQGNAFVLSVEGTFDSKTNVIAFSSATSQYDGMSIVTQGNGTFFQNNSGGLGLDLAEQVQIGNQWQLSIPSASIIYAPNVSSMYFGVYTNNSTKLDLTITQVGDEFYYRLPGGVGGEVPPTRIIPVPPPSPGGDGPEIDPGSMTGALTLLVGGLLTLNGRARRRSVALESRRVP